MQVNTDTRTTTDICTPSSSLENVRVFFSAGGVTEAGPTADTEVICPKSRLILPTSLPTPSSSVPAVTFTAGALDVRLDVEGAAALDVDEVEARARVPPPAALVPPPAARVPPPAAQEALLELESLLDLDSLFDDVGAASLSVNASSRGGFEAVCVGVADGR